MANLHSQIRIWNIFHIWLARPLRLPILSRMGNWAEKKSDTKVWFQLIIIMTIRPRGIVFFFYFIDHLVRYMAEVCSPLERKSMAVCECAQKHPGWHTHTQRGGQCTRIVPHLMNNNKYRPKCTLDLWCFIFFSKPKKNALFSVQEVCLIN